MDFQVWLGKTAPGGRGHSPESLGILVLSNLSLRTTRRPASEWASRFRRVDVDRFEAALAAVAPCLDVPGGGIDGAAATLEFRSLDDFHPDAFLSRLPIFKRLLLSRARLADPATFVNEAASLGASLLTAPPDSSTELAPTESTSATVERLLGRRPAESHGTSIEARARRGVDQLVRELVEPFLVPGKDPRQDELVRGVDEALSATLREVLHEPRFQRLEATWRSIHRLATTLDATGALSLELLDVSFDELREALLEKASPEGSVLSRLLIARNTTAGARPWSILLLDFCFGAGEEDVALLEALGSLARRLESVAVAAADPSLLGVAELPERATAADWKALDETVGRRWAAFRGSESARRVGLALPRLLVRAPYHARGERVEAFAFDEIPGVAERRRFLWGNPAYGCVELEARAFLDRLDDVETDSSLTLDDLPVFTFRDGSETRLRPCAESLFSESTAASILGRGLMPFLAYADRGAARLAQLRTLYAEDQDPAS